MIGPFTLAEWIRYRYQLAYGDQRLGNYTAWDLIRLFDEGQINEDTMMVAVGFTTPSRFAEGRLFQYKDELRALGTLGQAMMIHRLRNIDITLRTLCVAIGIWMLVYMVLGFIPTLAK